VITQSRVSGAEWTLVRLCQGLRQRGHQVLVACRPRSSLVPVLEEHSIPYREGPIHGKVNLRAGSWLARLVEETGAQLIHTHNSTASYHGTRVGRRIGVPTLAHVQGLHWRSTLKGCYLAASGLIACSRAVKQTAEEVGYPSDRIHVIYNAVDPSRFVPRRPPLEVRSELGLSLDDPMVLSVAHFAPKKGHVDLVAAIPEILTQFPRTRFVWVGEGSRRPRLEQLLRRRGLTGRVLFLGYRNDVADLMHACDLFVLPSHSEPMGIVYCEAMLMGKPVVACRSGGTPEVVEDGVTGLLVPPRNPAAVAAAITALLGDADRRRALGTAGRERAHRRFSYAQMLDAVEHIYERYITHPPSTD